MDSGDVIQLLIIGGLLSVSAFFTSAETALTSVDKLRMQSLAEEENRRAKTVLKITENSGKLLTTLLILDNIVNLSAAVLTAAWTARVLNSSLIGVSTGIITLLVLLFGEVMPRTFASGHAERLALAYAPSVKFLMKIMTPLVFLVTRLSQGLLILFRIDNSKKKRSLTEEELLTLVDAGHESGIIETGEREIIRNLFDFGDSCARDVMVPRIDMSLVSADATYQELLEIFREDSYTRYPVYENTTDTIIGTINMKDLLLLEHPETFSVRDILRDPYFTYENKNTADLLREMKKYSINLAIVLDEYGAIAGMITLEDLLEEIVGEIQDEYDEDEEEPLQELIPQKEYLAQGSAKLDDLNERLALRLESEDNDSIGGYIIEQLDYLPQAGESYTAPDGIRLVVDKMEKNRIETVHIYIPESFYQQPPEEQAT